MPTARSGKTAKPYVIVFTAAALLAAIAQTAFASESHDFHIAAVDASTAIREFATQSGAQIMVSADALKDKTLMPVVGEHSTEEALNILLADSGLEHKYVGERGVVLLAKNDTASSSEDSSTSPPQSGTKSCQENSKDVSCAPGPGKKDDKSELEEVVITGTNIRGAAPAGSPLMSFDRAAIDSSGYATVQQFMQALPQNLAKGAAGLGIGALAAGGADAEGTGTGYPGVGINLRGLGSRATLVLVNGQRLPASGNGLYTDVSMLPVSAIERIDVLTDGASAIYGADAVAGVTNIVLRQDYDGAETSLRTGTARDGAEEVQAAQSAGTNWQGGSVLASYEYYERDPLETSKRSYTAGEAGDPYLLPFERRNSAYVVAHEDLSDALSLEGNVLYSKRSYVSRYIIGDTLVRDSFDGENEQVGASLSGTLKITDTWNLTVGGQYGRTRGDDTEVQVRSNGLLTALGTNQYGESDVDGKLEGPLFAIGGGDVRLAAGVQYRKETALTYYAVPADSYLTTADVGRHSFSTFGELYVPLIGAANAVPLVERLTVSLAGRYDHYSDFGNTTNPKYGISWQPLEGLNLRGSYSTSFRAPSLTELTTPLSAFTANFLTPDFLYISGVVPGLQPERSRNWTAGFDVAPPSSGFHASVTYFDIDYIGRLSSATAAVGFTNVFAFADQLGAAIHLNQTPEQIGAAIDAITAAGGTVDESLPRSEVTAIVDDRTRNLAATWVNGIDIDISQTLATAVGKLGLGLTASYMLHFDNRLSPDAAAVDVVGTAYNPVDWRLRGNVTWTRGGVSVATYLNYVDSYKNISVTPVESVASWTTVDANVAYDFGARPGALHELKVALSAVNLFDAKPPFVSNPGQPDLPFDSTNANALGRFVALQATKKW